jgi:SAM-dependent methyltransferase
MARQAAQFAEIECVTRPASLAELDEAGYLAANPDAAREGLDARRHFEARGRAEGREQWVNRAAVERLRREKLARVRFRRRAGRTLEGGVPDYLTPALHAEFGIPEHSPQSAYPYWDILVDELRANPGKLYLDLGAGLRRTYYGNVVNAEIAGNISTDVLCVGEDLPFADASFAGVFAFSVLEHTLRPWEVAREMLRVLKPGGKLIVDYPFLQPVHGFPHNYFNATPEGHRSLFRDACDIELLVVNDGQKPIFALWWLLHHWQGGLAPEDAARFRALTVGELLARPPEAQLAEPYCRGLAAEVERIIPAGTTLVGIKKAPGPGQGLGGWVRRLWP